MNLGDNDTPLFHPPRSSLKWSNCKKLSIHHLYSWMFMCQN